MDGVFDGLLVGLTCERLSLDGRHLPDAGLFDPNAAWTSTPSTGIFSIGSVLYTTITGHWPHRTDRRSSYHSMEETKEYTKHVDDCFRNRKFPDIRGLYGEKVMYGCWTNAFTSADEVLQALDLEDEEHVK